MRTRKTSIADLLNLQIIRICHIRLRIKHDRIALWDKDPVISLNHGDDNTLQHIQFHDPVIHPLIIFGEADSDKMHIFFLTIFPDPFKPRILVDKSGRNDTGGDRDHADTKKCNKNTKNITNRGDRINITIAYREQSEDSPSDPGKCIRKNLRLRPVFQTVHTETGRQHQHQNDENRRQKLLFFADDNFRDDIQ